MRKILLLCFVLFLSLCCENKDPLAFTKVLLTEDSFEFCSTFHCPELRVHYLLAAGNAKISDKINSEIEEHVNEIFNSNKEGVHHVATIKEAVVSFITDYKQFETDFGNSFSEYKVETTMQISYFSENLVSIEFEYYLYTGGAHGYGGTNYLNFDVKTGERLSEQTLFTDFDGFLKYSENKFREVYKIPKDNSINSTGFWFENGAYYLPENIGFTDEEVVLIYNQDEIASYAEGPIQLKFPKEEVLSYLEFY
ncbi:MAG: hypothetical protein AUK33_04900 [Flavobacteriaceae bacterium CG2_30_34_30]|nr:DUF3298 and DUF4163 domain-containing protein [Flavobacteriia bacterium]OIP51296.1 MAG: hypothetical protein AUK33_04900 [Flavobacteriaceae bacterium CG2_30_34_30]PIQ18702.1 MAG: hypothetical protein COW66_05040 [Flavobacteriaceae bacterium CG18_big_fil_WC_8_21_14_2_50_34_36]PIV48748.1 MAG: hypothetical protein COS19_12150 [Flavobacteriaceae bacterium CG02_land_8_20_14_3_00_34_13]PIZ08145.1 MAG: hypothetical protein COY56_05470 [Flavobacteriaceae bacterium CG_4_10_14_0_8_um_filter_34_31]PJC